MSVEKIQSAKFQFAAVLVFFLALDILALFVNTHNARVSYAFSQMRLATILTLGALAIVWAASRYRLWDKVSSACPKYEAAPYLITLILLFTLFWAPVSFFSDFAQDDWRLLAAATERTELITHPYMAWFTLDTVDGNFRPLSTNILFVYFVHFFGLNSTPFLILNFIVNLLSVLFLFAIARELKFSPAAAMLAAMLYLSRGILYTLVGWPCTFGDGFVILSMAAIVWLILYAQRKDNAAIWAYPLGWCIFFLALFAKQSAFAIPGIVFLTVLLAPGREDFQFWPRIKWAFLVFLAYIPPVLLVFFHSKALFHGTTPYPIELSITSILHLLSYLSWYFFMLDFDGNFQALNALPWMIGSVILVSLALLLYCRPDFFAGRSRILLYTFLAAAASLALFALLPNRRVGYYGAMAAFWASMTIAALLMHWLKTAESPRSRQIVLGAICAFLLFGFVDVRLKQTGLIPSGGYIWGTFSGWRDRHDFEVVSRILDGNDSNSYDNVVFVDAPNQINYLAGVALLHENPRLKRILAYESGTRSWLSNNRQGLRPGSRVSDYADAGAYQWGTELSAARAKEILHGESVRWVLSKDGSACTIQPPGEEGAIPTSCP